MEFVEKLTLPVSAEPEPGLPGSLTVAVQMVCALTARPEGEHSTAVTLGLRPSELLEEALENVLLELDCDGSCGGTLIKTMVMAPPTINAVPNTKNVTRKEIPGRFCPTII
jgi:hypothetical protein